MIDHAIARRQIMSPGAKLRWSIAVAGFMIDHAIARRRTMSPGAKLRSSIAVAVFVIILAIIWHVLAAIGAAAELT